MPSFNYKDINSWIDSFIDKNIIKHLSEAYTYYRVSNPEFCIIIWPYPRNIIRQHIRATTFLVSSLNEINIKPNYFDVMRKSINCYSHENTEKESLTIQCF